MRKITILMLVMLYSFTQLHAEPTANETMAFIKKVIMSDEYSRQYNKYNKHNIPQHLKPKIVKISECKYLFSQTIDPHDKESRSGANIDFSKQKSTYVDDAIWTEDREGVASIKTYNQYYSWSKGWRKKSYNMRSRINHPIIINGVYKEKMNKALKHMSKICYQKYGVKNNDPF